MDFLNKDGVFDLDKLDAREYPLYRIDYSETVDVPLLNLIVEDTTTISEYRNVTVVDENGLKSVYQDENFKGKRKEDLPLFHPYAKNLIKKIVTFCQNGNQNVVTYSARRGGYGRVYANFVGMNDDGTAKESSYPNQHGNPSLTTISKRIRNTLYEYLGYKDFDFKASHPTIVKKLGEMLQIPTPRLNEWVADRDSVVKKLSDHHSVYGYKPLEESNIKMLVSAGLFGGGISNWAELTREGDLAWDILPKKVTNVGDDLHESEKWQDEHTWFGAFKREVRTIRNTLFERNIEFANRVCKPEDQNMPNDSSDVLSTKLDSRQRTFFSYFLNTIENECLHCALQCFVDKGVITAGKDTALAYDGFTSIINSGFSADDLQEVLKVCNETILETTGFPMRMVEKKMDKNTIVQHIIDMRKEGKTHPQTPKKILQLSAGKDPNTPRTPQTPQTPQTPDGLYVQPALSHPVYIAWKEKFEEKHMKIIESAGFIYFRAGNDYSRRKPDYLIEWKKSDLRNNYENDSQFVMEFTDINNKTKTQLFTPIDLWFKDPLMKTYRCVVNLPFGDIECPPDAFNTYKPSRFYGKEITADDPHYNKKAVDTFLKHIQIICNNEEEPSDFLLKWIASMIQTPQKKGVQIVITGQQGIGKTTLTDLLKLLVGGNTLETPQPERDVWGQFNILMCGCSLVVLSEVDKRNAFNADGRIKALITDGVININSKGKNPFTMESFHRFITLSNHYDAVATSQGDRRNFITQMSPVLKKDKEYWNYWHDKNVGVLSESGLLSIYSYLFHVDLTDFNPLPEEGALPRTQHHKSLLENRPPLQRFLMWFVSNTILNKSDELERDDIVVNNKDVRIQEKNMGVGLKRKIIEDNTKGFAVTTAVEMWADFNHWKQEGNKCEHIADSNNLLQKLKEGIIGQTFDMDKKSICPTFRRRNSNNFDTCWDIFSLRDKFVELGAFDSDSFVGGYSTQDDSKGLDNMKDMMRSIPTLDIHQTNDSCDVSSEDDEDDVEAKLAEAEALRRLAEAEAEVARLKAKKAKRFKSVAKTFEEEDNEKEKIRNNAPIPYGGMINTEGIKMEME